MGGQCPAHAARERADAGLDGPAARSGTRLATAGAVAPSAERALAAHSLSARGPETVNTVHGSAGGSADDGAPRFNDEPTALAAGGRSGEQRVDAEEPDSVRPSNAQAATPTTGCGVKPTSGGGGERQYAGDSGEKCIFPEQRECSYLGRYYYDDGDNQEYKGGDRGDQVAEARGLEGAAHPLGHPHRRRVAGVHDLHAVHSVTGIQVIQGARVLMLPYGMK